MTVALIQTPIFQPKCTELAAPHTPRIDRGEIVAQLETERRPVAADDRRVCARAAGHVEPRHITRRQIGRGLVAELHYALRVAQPQPRHRMRLASISVSFTMDLGAVNALDVFALISTTLTSSADARVRASATDPAALASLAYDSGVVAGATDAKWLGQVLILPPTTCNARYVRWDLNDVSGSAIDIGLAPTP